MRQFGPRDLHRIAFLSDSPVRQSASSPGRRPGHVAPSHAGTPIPTSLLDDAWSRLAAASEQSDHAMRQQVFATVDAGGFPDARLLDLRRANRSVQTLWYYTDARSRTIDQLSVRNRVCVVGFDAADSVQLRLWGHISVHCEDAVAFGAWDQLDDLSHARFANPLAPGQPVARFERHAVGSGAQDDDGPANFAVLELSLSAIEWLRLDTDGGFRAMLRATDGWQTEVLVP